MQSSQIRNAHFDCQFGAGGDMLLACLLDSGLIEPGQLIANLQRIAIAQEHYQIRVESVTRCSLRASRLVLECSEQEDERNLHEIKTIIENSQIDSAAKELSCRIFERLARAESRVHGTELEAVHFHEIGAIDSIIDIVGFAMAFTELKIDKVSCSALPLGSGTVKTRHGLFPVPAPAVLELLQEAGAPISNLQIPFECLTPTAAAVLCQISTGWTMPEGFQIIKSGTGAGSKDCPDHPNIVRVVIGNTDRVNRESRFRQEEIAVIETNIDDQSPQFLSYVTESLYRAGALDVVTTPCLMKKGRSGHTLSIICRPEDSVLLQEKLLCESTSIGVRCRLESRLAAERRLLDLSLDGHNIKMKVASDRAGKIINVQPEFEDLSLYAKASGMSIKEAQERAFLAYSRETCRLSEAKARLQQSFSLDGE